jgi:hypothetical protein
VVPLNASGFVRFPISKRKTTRSIESNGGRSY